MSTTSIPNEPLQPERQGMSTAAKVLLALVAFAILFALCAMFFAFVVASAIGFSIVRSVETEPVEVTSVASNIATFDLLSGYDNGQSISGLGFSLVSYHGAAQNSHIMFAQIPSWVRADPAEFERQARQAAQGEVDRWSQDYRFEIVAEETITIRGQEETMTIGEGTRSDGERYREIIVPFEGRGGQALLIIVAPVDSWDQAQVDAFIASIQ